MEKDNNIAHII